MVAVNIAFEAPENLAVPVAEGYRPFDFVHLANQTMGDKELELEILQLFARNARSVLQQLSSASGEEISRLAHRLKGSAQAVGAVRVSIAAGALEDNHADVVALAEASAAVVEAENFIQKLCR